ncbi:hypothetical protein A946_03865 [Methylacidiphilum kamchatkense Kam1]|uniref:DUF2971 family protein n=1 Tax=Methylacidiphilum kamchatkense Kam1 TaxID=1202785 RepID=A0A0C1RW45_9BACT|nr:DUF2971 domain-containing protein [Methylacidiphilum kamchatkense]KIE59151.1 hypothetical protein A946_03865 [Methylacidiphilum kamchatkense Kam1]QDQ42921.1 hypothetical protein kam1_1706 [Methylacidiphilum kamchatkense Kam1]
MKDIPTSVIRFYGEPKYALEVVEKKEITFIHNYLMNDPFDPYLVFETDFEKNYQALLQHVRAQHPEDIDWFSRCILESNWQRFLNEIDEFLLSLKRQLFLFSTSAEKDGVRPVDNLYMWGHYGRGHRGVAIEFNTDPLEKDVKKLHTQYTGTPINLSCWVQIDYVDDMSLITAEMFYQFYRQEHQINSGWQQERQETELDRHYKKMEKAKSKVWEKENEWRIRWSGNDPGTNFAAADIARLTQEQIQKWFLVKCPITQSSIKAIYLGLGLNQDIAEQIKERTRSNFPDARIYTAKKEHGRFGLEFQ